jgi:hypothetical protein
MGLTKKHPSAQQTAETMHRLRLGHPEDGMREIEGCYGISQNFTCTGSKENKNSTQHTQEQNLQMGALAYESFHQQSSAVLTQM